MKTLLFRVDANSRMGTGHVMRCLALAQAWQAEGGEAVFLTAESTPTLNLRLAAEGVETRSITALGGSAADAEQCARRCLQFQADLLVLDGYQFDAEFQRRLKRHGIKLLAFDDFGHAGEYSADFVLNQTNCADEKLYARRSAHTELFLGTKFVSFRREFWPWADVSREHPRRVRRILVTLGGADPDLATTKVIDGLRLLSLDDCETTVVLGAGNAHVPQVREHFWRSGLRGQIIVNAANMPELMAASDLAISAGGSTVWEFALLGVPCVSLVLADNQAPCLAELAGQGAVINLGRQHAVSAEAVAGTVGELLDDRHRRAELARRLGSYVDIHGARRVLSAVSPSSNQRSPVRRAA